VAQPEICILGGIILTAATAAVYAHITPPWSENQPIQMRGEQGLIRDVARRFCVDARALGDAIEQEKRRSGRGGRDNLSIGDIEEIARSLPKIPGCTATSE
jgi:hypothetical protein